MRFFIPLVLIIMCAGLLTACGGEANHADILTPLPATPKDPSDAELKIAVMEFLRSSNAPVSSTYQYRRIDLDGDKRRDALVLFNAPFGYWCGKDGCTMLVMHAAEDDFSLVNSVVPIREPLYVSREETNGWHDIIAHVSGRWSQTKNVAMQFDGHEYPNNPDNLPAYLAYAEPVRVF